MSQKSKKIYKVLALKNVQVKYAAIEKPREPSQEELAMGKRPEYTLSVMFKKTDTVNIGRIDTICKAISKELNITQAMKPFYSDGLLSSNALIHDYYYFNSRSMTKPSVIKADGTPFPEATFHDFSIGTYVNVVLDICNYLFAGQVGFSKYIKLIQIVKPSDMDTSFNTPDYQAYLNNMSDDSIEIPLEGASNNPQSNEMSFFS